MRHVGGRKIYNQFFVRMTEGKRKLWKPRRRWEDNVKINLKEILREDVDWIHLAENAKKWNIVVNTAINLRIPKEVGNSLTVSFSISILLHILG